MVHCFSNSRFSQDCCAVWRLSRTFKPPHDKTNKIACAPSNIEIVFAVRMKKATHCAHNEDSDQTGRMPRLIWVFAGRTVILLVLSWDGSFTVRSHSVWNPKTRRQLSKLARLLCICFRCHRRADGKYSCLALKTYMKSTANMTCSGSVKPELGVTVALKLSVTI